ncbi:MAG: endonuclease/exonuclease/phosphatase family protein, partial [Candidatus Eisenbacteria bacterium]
MRVVTWNVNSIRARLPRVLEFLERQKPDVVMLQELKCMDDQFPRDAIEEAGYSAEVFGQKTYNGVGILARHRLEDVFRGMGDEVEDAEARVIGA